MAPSFFKDMKGGKFSCASPASLAVCTSIDRRSMVLPAIVSRTKPNPPSIPKTNRKSSEYRNSTSSIVSTKDLISPATSSRYLLTDSTFFDIFPDLEPDVEPTELSLVPIVESPGFKRDEPSPIKHYDQAVPISSPRLLHPRSKVEESSPATTRTHHDGDRVRAPSLVPISSPRVLREHLKVKDSSSAVLRPSSSTRAHHDHDRVRAPSLVPISSPRVLREHLKVKDSSSAVLRPSSSTRAHHDHDQVVVLRVSLHCKGCEGKVRKHISKMQGVTSFDIDFMAKKVTVTGNVTPLGVLNSVSKVKNAQFWPSPPRSSASF